MTSSRYKIGDPEATNSANDVNDGYLCHRFRRWHAAPLSSAIRSGSAHAIILPSWHDASRWSDYISGLGRSQPGSWSLLRLLQEPLVSRNDWGTFPGWTYPPDDSPIFIHDGVHVFGTWHRRRGRAHVLLRVAHHLVGSTRTLHHAGLRQRHLSGALQAPGHIGVRGKHGVKFGHIVSVVLLMKNYYNRYRKENNFGYYQNLAHASVITDFYEMLYVRHSLNGLKSYLPSHVRTALSDCHTYNLRRGTRRATAWGLKKAFDHIYSIF